jgi:hypothetical protein
VTNLKDHNDHPGKGDRFYFNFISAVAMAGMWFYTAQLARGPGNLRSWPNSDEEHLRPFYPLPDSLLALS